MTATAGSALLVTLEVERHDVDNFFARCVLIALAALVIGIAINWTMRGGEVKVFDIWLSRGTAPSILSHYRLRGFYR